MLSGLSCKNKMPGQQSSISSNVRLNDSTFFDDFLEMGDSVYANKNSFTAFSDAMKYFDSAAIFAEKTQDSVLIAEAIFAKARVYDAWNKSPEKTIELFDKAAKILSRMPGQYIRSRYARHLLAHAYEKAGDSSQCVDVLQNMYTEISALPDSVKMQMDYIPEMALIATQVRNYTIANDILNLVKRDWIKNDQKTFNYLDHYYITKSRIAIFNQQEKQTPFLDSLEMALGNLNNLMDKMYYSHEISILYEFAGNTGRALTFAKLSNDASQVLNNSEGIGNMQNRLLQSELENEKRKQELIEKEKQSRLYIMLALGMGLLVISALLFRLKKQNKQYKSQSLQLADANDDLDKKVSEIDLLNKDMQHRIKNNLQTVFSLLQMQERHTSNEGTLEELQQARLRIESIAILHEHLTHTPREQKVDFNKYITSMANKAVDCFANGKQVQINLNIEEGNIPENKNFPLALILNEWITNSLKYAETRGNVLHLNIDILKKENGFAINYYDNGLENDKAITKEGVGTQIVVLLCAQMKAVLAKNGKPYNYTLSMPYGQ